MNGVGYVQGNIHIIILMKVNVKDYKFFKLKSEEDIKKALEKNKNNNIIPRRIEETYYHNYLLRNIDDEWRAKESRVGHIIIDNEHPYNFPPRRNREYVDFFYAYAMMNKCKYFGYILLYFFMSLEFCGILMHDRLLDLDDPHYNFHRRKVYMNKKFNKFILLSLIFMQFIVYFFFNFSIMILISIPQIFYRPFFYYIRQGYYNLFIYNVSTGSLGIKINYGR